MAQTETRLSLSVIVVNHNGGELLAGAVAALQRHTVAARSEIVIVDSASSDGSAENLPRGPLAVRVIRCQENVGFCQGNNLGARDAQGALLCFTQPDGQVQEGWDVPLRAALEDQAIAAAGGLVLKMGEGERIDSAGLAIAPNMAAWSVSENLTSAQAGLQGGRCRDVAGVSPAFLMTRRSSHEAIGGFWEALWMYGDEADYALRLARVGRIVLCPESRMLHMVGGSAGAHQSPLRLYQSSRNRLLNIARHLPGRRVPGAVLLAAAFDGLALAQQRNRPAVLAVGRGWLAGLRGWGAARRLSSDAERAANLRHLATLREAISQQRALGRASLRRSPGPYRSA
jgi:N-acetylglucosaminyl-diphospho-decaprenol L-rhamnosyltransferase